MNTHNNIINGLPVLRIWHSFNAEKLQNIDGQGKDLLPLPNIKRLTMGDEIVNFPYIDILLRDSKITPQILVYSGKTLSLQQEQLFEDLSKRAKNIGGQVFVVNYKNIEGRLTYSKMLNFHKILEEAQAVWSRLSSNVERVEENAYRYARGDFIDLQRLAILYDMDSVFDFIEKAYQVKFNSREILYADFDRQIQPIINLLENNQAQRACEDGILIPVKTYPLLINDKIPTPANRAEQIKALNSAWDLEIHLENNFVYCTKSNSSFIKEVMEVASNESIDLKTIFQTMCGILLKPIKDILKLKKFNSRLYPHSLNINLDLLKRRNTEVLDVVTNEISKIGLLMPLAQGLEGTGDVSWGKDIPILILADHYKERQVSAKLIKVTEPEAQENIKTPNLL